MGNLTASEKQKILAMLDNLESSRRTTILVGEASFGSWLKRTAYRIYQKVSGAITSVYNWVVGIFRPKSHTSGSPGYSIPDQIFLPTSQLPFNLSTSQLPFTPPGSLVGLSLPTGEIRALWVNHNVFDGDRKGMRIHIDFSAKNLKNVGCRATAYFHYEDGTKLWDCNDSYCTVDGQISAGRDFTPRYDNSRYEDFTLFMPYSEFHLGRGRYSLYLQVELYVKLTKMHFAESECFYFDYTK